MNDYLLIFERLAQSYQPVIVLDYIYKGLKIIGSHYVVFNAHSVMLSDFLHSDVKHTHKCSPVFL